MSSAELVFQEQITAGAMDPSLRPNLLSVQVSAPVAAALELAMVETVQASRGELRGFFVRYFPTSKSMSLVWIPSGTTVRIHYREALSAESMASDVPQLQDNFINAFARRVLDLTTHQIISS